MHTGHRDEAVLEWLKLEGAEVLQLPAYGGCLPLQHVAHIYLWAHALFSMCSEHAYPSMSNKAARNVAVIKKKCTTLHSYEPGSRSQRV